ncbi:hemin uptake protein HemP [Tropicibacter sp. R15_0]|uniref:hemin uptake protein HemP n=1 Tax=Tropicibacter sp. R15_0 TaxID=2821101 RepID=UPI001ADA676C|nr:hemin uptake protein HemP [Tropicibacter sp. R15_0]MBO9467817.1 hemin uptake protein HemP [Tropicibacter sp. R15_0]
MSDEPQDVMPKTAEPRPLYDAVDLTKGGNQANIVLDEKIYTLRITRAGKLILTK